MSDDDYIAKLLADGKREVDIKMGEQKAWLANAFPSYAELLDYAAVMKITFEQHQAFFPNFMRENIEFGAKVQKTQQAKKNAKTKLENDPRQKAKLLIKAEWDRWQANPSDYATQAIFIKDMEDHFPEIKRSNTFAEWCAKWNKEKPTSAS